MKLARVIRVLLSIGILAAVLPARLDAADRSVRQQLLHMLALPVDQVHQTGESSIIMENQSTLLGLLADHAMQGGILTDRQLINALSWIDRAPSVEAIVGVDAIAQRNTNQAIRIACDAFFRNMSKTRDSNICLESSVAGIEVRLAKGGFSNDLVPILLSRALVRQGSQVGETYLVQALGGGQPASQLLEASASLLDHGCATDEAKAFLRSVLVDHKVCLSDRIRAAEILATVDKDGGMQWLKAQVDQVTAPDQRLQFGRVLARMGDVQGPHILLGLLEQSGTDVAIAGEQALRDCFQDLPEALSKGGTRKRAEVWRAWLDEHQGHVRWDATRKKFICPSGLRGTEK